MNQFRTSLVLLLAYSVALILGEFTANDCRDLGFIKTQLLCSSCDNLKDFGLEEIKEQCFECCQKESGSSVGKKYHRAVLEVCTCKFGAYPQIQAFIKSERPSKFKNLQIKYLRGLDPQIKLYDKKGSLVETLSITKWNTDTVEEFFATRLESDSDGGSSSRSSSSKEDNDEEDFLKTNRI